MKSFILILFMSLNLNAKTNIEKLKDEKFALEAEISGTKIQLSALNDYYESRSKKLEQFQKLLEETTSLISRPISSLKELASAKEQLNKLKVEIEIIDDSRSTEFTTQLGKLRVQVDTNYQALLDAERDIDRVNDKANADDRTKEIVLEAFEANKSFRRGLYCMREYSNISKSIEVLKSDPDQYLLNSIAVHNELCKNHKRFQL